MAIAETRKMHYVDLYRCKILIRHYFLVQIKAVQYIIYYAIHGTYRNGASVHIYTCGVVEYRASENVTPTTIRKS